MLTFLKIVPILLPLLTALPGFIHSAETAFGHKPGSGAAKKQLVLDTIDAGLSVASSLGVQEVADDATKQAIKAVAGGLTDSIVAGLNAAGALKKDAPQA